MQSTKIRWKKGRGTLTLLNGRTVGPNETFRASLEEIPDSFRDTVTPLDSIQEKSSTEKNAEKNDEEVLQEENRYIKEEKSRGWYNVLDTETGDYVNEKALRQDEADALIEEKLGGGSIEDEEE